MNMLQLSMPLHGNMTHSGLDMVTVLVVASN